MIWHSLLSDENSLHLSHMWELWVLLFDIFKNVFREKNRKLFLSSSLLASFWEKSRGSCGACCPSSRVGHCTTGPRLPVPREESSWLQPSEQATEGHSLCLFVLLNLSGVWTLYGISLLLWPLSSQGNYFLIITLFFFSRITQRW